MSEHVSYELRVNGERREVEDGWLGESLLYVLRERAGLGLVSFLEKNASAGR